jgi:hypothetical protein
LVSDGTNLPEMGASVPCSEHLAIFWGSHFSLMR